MAGPPNKKDRWRLRAAVVVGPVLFLAPVAFGLFRHFAMGQRFSGLGEFGDFVGGFANPLLALLGYLALLYTVVLQRAELTLSREELTLTRQELERSASALESQVKHLERQDFSKAFFDLFEMYKSVVAGLEHGSKENRRSGKAALAGC